MYALDKLAEQQAEEDEGSEDDEETSSPLGRIYKLNKPELCFYLIGAIFAILNGAKDPAFAFVFTG